METYAVVEAGGKQFKVKKGDRLAIEHVEAEPGETIDLDRILAVGGGAELAIGTPTVEGAKVVARVVEQTRGDKVIAFKKKRRKGYHKKIGHRQMLTQIEVDDIHRA